jgi:hypothetical protein
MTVETTAPIMTHTMTLAIKRAMAPVFQGFSESRPVVIVPAKNIG